MKFPSLILLSLIITIILNNPVDVLNSMNSGILTPTITDTINKLKSGTNDFTFTFSITFSSTPKVIAALFSFSSTNFAHYAISISISTTTTSTTHLVITLNQNLWTSLSYNIIASIADSVVLGYSSISLGSNSSTTTPTTKSITLLNSLVTNVQDLVKFDVFIMGFNIQLSSSSSQFYLNVAINYGTEDSTQSLFSTYNDYVYKLTSGSLPAGIAITSTTLSLALSWLGILTQLQLSYISHPVQQRPLAQSQLTTGFNTLAITSSSNLLNITLFNPMNNKNNLGSLNTVNFYGFTGIGLTPLITLDASITLKYSYFVNLTTTGSTINFLKTSYYFYQPLANSIVDYLFNQQIPISWDDNMGTLTPATSILNSYYTINFGANDFFSTSSSFNQLDKNQYMFILQGLDSQSCTGSSSLYFTFQFQNDPNQKYDVTPGSVENFNYGCSNTSIFSTPVQNLFAYMKLFSSATSIMSTKIKISSDFHHGTLYLKNLKLFSLSTNQFIDPNILESTVNAFQSFYTYDLNSCHFYSSFTNNTVSNALLMNVNKNNKVTITTYLPQLNTEKNYTLSFYILDSVGNISNLFSSPVLKLFLQNYSGVKTLYYTLTPNITNPLCNPSFNATSPLTIPVDSFYLPIIITLKVIQKNTILRFQLSDQSNSNHMYAIRGITLKYIQFFDPIARTNGISCPKNTYFNINTQPATCQACDVFGKIDSGSTCICPVGKYDDGINVQCALCSNSCASCSENANHCLSCFSGNILDQTTFTCKCSTNNCVSNSSNSSNSSSISSKFQQDQCCITLITFLRSLDHSPLNSNCIKSCASATIIFTQYQEKSTKVTLQMTILDVIFLSNNIVEFCIRNPDIDIDNALIIITINNSNINQTIIQFQADHLYSTNTINQVQSPGVTSQVLLSILLFIMLIFYILGNKNNHTINFIQKLSFLRFNLPIVPSIFSFLYSLRYSYYDYGRNSLQNVLPPYYLQNSSGNYYLIEKDANILRHVGIPIIISIGILSLRFLGLVIFKNKMVDQNNQNNQNNPKKLTLKKCYYRTIQYFQKTIMFQIIFFSIAEITFANLYGIYPTADPSTYKASLAFAALYLFYFAILTTMIVFYSQKSKEEKIKLISEYIFDLVDSIIIVQASNTQILALIITIVAKYAFEMFLSYSYDTFSKFDLIKVIIMGLQVALISILSSNINSILSIYALFVCIVVIDIIYVIIKIFLKMTYKENKEVVNQMTSVQVINIQSLDSIKIVHISQ